MPFLDHEALAGVYTDRAVVQSSPAPAAQLPPTTLCLRFPNISTVRLCFKNTAAFAEGAPKMHFLNMSTEVLLLFPEIMLGYTA